MKRIKPIVIAFLTVLYGSYFLHLAIALSKDLRQQGGQYLMVLYPPGGWNWTDKALPDNGATQGPACKAIGGTISAVQLPPTPEETRL